jgi:hypothetical protein
MTSDFCTAIKNIQNTKSGIKPKLDTPPLPTFVKDEYVNYWKIIDESENQGANTGLFKDNAIYKEYRQYYIDDTKGYPNYIKNIDLSGLKDYDIKSIETLPWNFINIFLEQIFDTISKQPYLKEKYIINNINRPNHGGLNHFRSFLFSQYITSLFLEKKPDLFKTTITNNKIEVLFLVLASYFQSLLRVNESSNPVPFFKQNTSKTNTSFTKIFNTLNNPDIVTYFTDENSNMAPYMTTLASSFLFMSICKYLKKINKTIENNLSDEFIDKIGIGLCMFEKDPLILQTTNVNLQSIYLIYTIVAFGHYADHCRQSWSAIVDEPHITFLLDTIGIETDITKRKNDENFIKLIKYIILLLSYTEWNRDNTSSNTFTDLSLKSDDEWKQIIDSNTSSKLCRTYAINRYNNPNFQKFSKDYMTMSDDILGSPLDSIVHMRNMIMSAMLEKMENPKQNGGTRNPRKLRLSRLSKKSRLTKKLRKSKLPKKSRKLKTSRLPKNN